MISYFYKNFLYLCALRGITPSQFSAQTGIGRSTTSAWKRGTQPFDSTLEKTANFFGVAASNMVDIDMQSLQWRKDEMKAKAEAEKAQAEKENPSSVREADIKTALADNDLIKMALFGTMAVTERMWMQLFKYGRFIASTEVDDGESG